MDLGLISKLRGADRTEATIQTKEARLPQVVRSPTPRQPAGVVGAEACRSNPKHRRNAPGRKLCRVWISDSAAHPRKAGGGELESSAAGRANQRARPRREAERSRVSAKRNNHSCPPLLPGVHPRAVGRFQSN